LFLKHPLPLKIYSNYALALNYNRILSKKPLHGRKGCVDLYIYYKSLTTPFFQEKKQQQQFILFLFNNKLFIYHQ